MPTRRCGDRQRGDIVLGWLTKVVVVMAILGAGLFDVISVGAAHVAVVDAAQQAAAAASQSWEDGHDAQAAFAAAQATLEGSMSAVDPVSFALDRDGRAHVTVHRTARTLLLDRIGPLAHYARVSTTADVRSTP